jgi:hypothetical protein
MYLPTPVIALPASPARFEVEDDDDPLIASDGLTIDTEFGFVDLVAVDRVLRGHPTALTRADLVYLLRKMPRSKVAAVLVAEAFLPA